MSLATHSQQSLPVPGAAASLKRLPLSLFLSARFPDLVSRENDTAFGVKPPFHHEECLQNRPENSTFP